MEICTEKNRSCILYDVYYTFINFYIDEIAAVFQTGWNDETQFAYYMNQVALGYVADYRRPMPHLAESPLFSFVDASRVRHYFYEVPVMEQYFSWLKGILTEWNWGTSTYIMPNVSAIVIIGKRLPVSISINIISVLVSVPLGILLGIWAALKKNKPTDHIISTGIMILYPFRVLY